MDDLVNKLLSGIVTVTFTKTDGNTRVLRGTLDPNVTGIPYHDSEDSTVQPIFDVDVNEWRAFRKDSLISSES